MVRANPRSTTFVALAHALSDAGRDEEAEDVCRQGLAQHPRLTTGQVALGRALFARGRLREAQDVLIEAAKASPEHGDAFRWLGEVILKRGDRDRARAVLEYAEELSPSEAVIAELLTRAGGRPLPRSARPKTDFEHTRVGNARALAERMHEDPPEGGEDNEERATPIVELRSKPGGELEAHPGPGAASGSGPTRLRPGGRRPSTDSDVGLATPAPGPGAADARGGALGRLLHRSLSRWQGLPRSARLGVPAGLLALALAVVFLVPRGDDPPVAAPAPVATESTPAVPAAPAFDVTGAITDGGLERLQAARAHGKQVPAASGNADGLAQLALVNALLASEHAQSTAADADELAQASEKVGPPPNPRRAQLEAARTLAALASGRLDDARAAAERATAADATSTYAWFASGRVKHLEGDLEAAARALDKAAEPVGSGGPAPGTAGSRLTLAVLERAVVALDAGDVGTAAPALDELLGTSKDLLRARLLRAEAGRSASEPPEPDQELTKACRNDGRDTPVLRSQCAVENAVTSRLAGDRAASLKAARAAVAGSRRQVYARGVAQGALALVTLGDVDGAGEALRRIREESTPAFPPRALAEIAVTAARGERVVEPPPSARLSSPDGRLLAARLAFARGGPKEMRAFAGGLSRQALEQDGDLRFLVTLGDEGKLEGDLRKDITRRADKGSSLAAYVLGRHELAAGNRKNAGKWLAQALKGHGDSCEAARLLLSLDARDRPSALRKPARVVQAVRGRNGGCVHAKP